MADQKSLIPMECIFCAETKTDKGFFDEGGYWACDKCGAAEWATQAIERAQGKLPSRIEKDS